MGCSSSSHITPNASSSLEVIHNTSSKRSAVTPLPPSHPLSSSLSSSLSPSLSHSLSPSLAQTEKCPSGCFEKDKSDSDLIYTEKQSSQQNLVALCKKGKLNLIQDLIKLQPKIDINQKGMWSNTPLIVSCQYNHPDIALYLLNLSGIDVIHMNEYGASALLYACLEGLSLVVDKLISMGCNPNSKPALIYNSLTDKTDYFTPLIAAIVNGHSEIVNSLILAGCSINMVISQKSDQVALINGKKERIDIGKVTPLMLACRYQHRTIIEYLFSSSSSSSSSSDGSLLNYKAQDSEGSTALHYLCRIKKTSGNASGSNQSTATGAASVALPSVSSESSSPVDLLLLFLSQLSQFSQDQSSNPVNDILFLSDMKGSIPLHAACESQSSELVQSLLQAELNLIQSLPFTHSNPLSNSNNSFKLKQVKVENTMGYTPLHISIKKRSTDIVKILLKYGSDPFQVTYNSNRQNTERNEKCAYDAAMKLRQNTEIYQLLSQYQQEKDLKEEKKEEEKESQHLLVYTPTGTQHEELDPATEDDDLHGQEMRIQELVTSIGVVSTPAAVPYTSTAAARQRNDKEQNESDDEEANLLARTIIATATSVVDDILMTSGSSSLSLALSHPQPFQTPFKVKPIHQALELYSTPNQTIHAPKKETTKERNSRVMSGLGLDLDDSEDMVRIASPIFTEEAPLILVSP